MRGMRGPSARPSVRRPPSAVQSAVFSLAVTFLPLFLGADFWFVGLLPAADLADSRAEN